MLQRFIVGVIAGGLLLVSIFIHQWAFIAVLVVVMYFGLAEMNLALSKGGYHPIQLPGYLCALLLLPAYYYFSFTGVLFMIMFTSMVTASTVVFSSKKRVIDIALTLFTYVYPLMPFSVLLFMGFIQPDNLRYLILLQLFAYTYAADSFAYLSGRFFGKHKLCERLSPKKTVEGAVGGILGSLAFGIVFYIVCENLFKIRYHFIHYMVIAGICSLAGIVGDLFASAIKRNVGIKDYGTVFPGHGGIIDRVDSILFSAPFVYAYYYLFILG
ncbi:MAG: phosphatidate cytidylyltransferase [Christensenellales bacterium]